MIEIIKHYVLSIVKMLLILYLPCVFLYYMVHNELNFLHLSYLYVLKSTLYIGLHNSGSYSEFKGIIPSCYQAVQVESQKSLEDLSRLLKREFSFRKMETSHESISLVTKPSLHSWGETVLVELSSFENGKFQLHVSSRSVFGLFDYAKNYKNLLKIKNVIAG